MTASPLIQSDRQDQQQDDHTSCTASAHMTWALDAASS